MRSRRLLLSTGIAGLRCLLSALPALAQGGGPKGAVAGKERDRGLMLRVGIGLDGCTDDWCDHIDPSVALRTVALYRVMKYFAAGMHVAFLFGNPDSSYADRALSLFVGAEGRGIFPWRRLDAWVSLALGYNRSMLAGEVCTLIGCVDYSGWDDAIALGFGTGADFFITRSIAVGAGFYMYKPWPRRGCTEVDGDTSCREPSADDMDRVGVIWSITAMFTYFFPL